MAKVVTIKRATEDHKKICVTALPSDPEPDRAYSLPENSVGVLPVTWRNACEKAGTLA
jgi:hypothetical protein